MVHNAECERKEDVEKWMVNKDLIILYNHEQINYKLASDQSYSHYPSSLVIKEAIVKTIPLHYTTPSHLRFQLLHSQVQIVDRGAVGRTHDFV